MTLPAVAVGDPHAAAHNAERTAINAATTAVAAKYTKPGTGIPSIDLAQSLQDSIGSINQTEIAYGENISSVATQVSGNFTYYAIDGCGITVPPQSGPFKIDWEGTVAAVTAGAGVLYIALMEIPPGGGTATVVSSALKEILATNSGTYSKIAGTIKGSKRFDSSSTTRIFSLQAVNLLDTSSPLTSQVYNSASNPTWIGAYKV